MQYAAKQALLDEVAAVAIDLYSGRFSIEDGAAKASDVSELDEQRFAPELEPVRIVLVEQTSSGKSSLINALKQELVAESGCTAINGHFNGLQRVCRRE